MANPVQWTVDQFYAELKKLDTAGRQAIANLNAQKLRLQEQYTVARNASDAARMEFLKPLISRNSALRINANEYKAKFNDLVNKASSLIRGAGLVTPPNLGIVPVIVGALVPAAWILGIIAAWAIVNKLTSGRDAIDHALGSNGPALIEIANDPNRTAEERKAALDALAKLYEKAGASNDWIKDLTPVLGIVALIVLAPSIMKLIPSRRSA